MMGYYNDSDSDDYVNLAASPAVLSPEEEAIIRDVIAGEAEELRRDLDKRLAADAADAAKFRAEYEAKIYKEAAFVAFHRDDEWMGLAEQGYVDRQYSSVWLGYWTELRSSDDVRRVLRVGGDVIKAWMKRLVEKVEAMPAFSKERASCEKMEASVSEDRDYNKKRVKQYVESRLSFHGLR